MLEMRHLRKHYTAGSEKIPVLKGICLQFRPREFAAILGPSGCGKTTLLNLIGGLDHDFSGEMRINGVSTRDFRDRDWDHYRNHTIGFVFQSYHLIPHLTVLQNVEMALTLSGMSRQQRRKKAMEALRKVGLSDQLQKKPSQMSGGQMQRAAIARAVVNDPQIVLADEPTGALDTESSLQVMEILKEISQDRLVIMVTHNPALADRYATRTIEMLDGEILRDSAPPDLTETVLFQKTAKKAEPLPSMTPGTSFLLSLKNLLSKKIRTALTAFAGSIGIIGIALILAVSQGADAYIRSVQEETLTACPLTLEASSVDMTAMVAAFMQSVSPSADHDRDAVYPRPMLRELTGALCGSDQVGNDLGAFQVWLENRLEEDPALNQALNGIAPSYGADPLFLVKDPHGEIIRSNSREILERALCGAAPQALAMLPMLDSRDSFMGLPLSIRLWTELLPARDGSPVSPILLHQYDLVYGSWPRDKSELVLILDENNELDDLTLYALGLKPAAQLADGETAPASGSWSYETLCSREFRVVCPGDCFFSPEQNGIYQDLQQTPAGLRYLYDNGISLHISGVIRPNAHTTAPMLTGSVGYTRTLTEYLLSAARASDPVQAQLSRKNTDIFTGLPFQTTIETLSNPQKAAAFREYAASLPDAEKAAVYARIQSVPSAEIQEEMMRRILETTSRQEMEAMVCEAMARETAMGSAQIGAYLEKMEDSELEALFLPAAAAQFRQEYAAQAVSRLPHTAPGELARALERDLSGYSEAVCARYYDEIMEFSQSTLEENLKKLGYADPGNPTAISLYASGFSQKRLIEDAISDYNRTVPELSRIRYTDYVGLVMRSVTSMVTAMTKVLVGFVAISLVVSSIMIGVITLISVQERTREIGILRAMGASRGNIALLFNAETMLIGLFSGVFGVFAAHMLCDPVSKLILHVTGIPNLRAALPSSAALPLVLVSVVLTLIAGMIPARHAAGKDPVAALRSE